MRLFYQTRFPRLRLCLSAVAALMLLQGCSQKPYAKTNKNYKKQVKAFASKMSEQPKVPDVKEIGQPDQFVGTTNMSMRKPNYVMLHHTSQDRCSQTLQTFTLPRTEVSAHYVICRDGIVYHMLSDYLRAHHAGTGRWGSVTDMNSCSIGIELDNDGKEAYNEAQLKSLIRLLDTLKKAYNIPAANFIGHADYAPTRKDDPGLQFPWKRLSKAGFGLWYDESNDKAPKEFDELMALRILGYDVQNPEAAIRAFNRHYRQKNSVKLNDEDRRALYSLFKKVM